MNPDIWTPERQKIARETARKWRGTPHRDRVATVGMGIDCINFVYEVLIDAGILERREIGFYNTRVGLHETTEKMKRAFKMCARCEEHSPDDPQFGDIAIFKEGKFSAHSAIVIDGSLWQSLSQRTVLESHYAAFQRHIDCLLRITECGLIGEPSEAAKL